jgi:glycosyltransferase involved in cell wall biosynthesis
MLAEELVRLGVRADHVETVPFGVDTGRFRPPEEGEEEGGGTDRPLLMVSLRHFHTVYDPLTVVRAAAVAAQNLPGFRGEMAGDGPLRAEAVRLVENLGLADKMAFPGLLTEVEVARKLAGAVIYVSAALSDSTSVSLLEAMACGCFPVAADIPGNREWITDGENGLLFGPGDPIDLAAKIVRAHNDRELRTGAAAVNRRLVMDRASLAGTIDRIESLFSKLLDGKDRDR